MAVSETVKTIGQQIGTGRMKSFVGAYNWLAESDNALSFRFKMCKKANYMRIRYDEGQDLYTVTFKKIGRAPKFTITEVGEYPGIFCDQLHNLFEQVTGLVTRL